LKRLNLSSSFLTAEGKGDLDDFSLHLGVDLEKAGLELGKVFLLPWSARGELSLEATALSDELNRYGVNFQLISPKIFLSYNDRDILPENPLRILGQFDFLKGWQLNKNDASLQVIGALWPGSFALSLENMHYSDQVLTAGYSLSTTLDLDKMGAVLNDSQVETAYTMKGNLHVAATGFFTENKILIRELDARLTDYTYQQGEVSVAEKELSLLTRRPAALGDVPVTVFPLQIAGTMQSWQAQGSGLSGYDWSEQQLFIRDMDLLSSALKLEVKELVVDDPGNPESVWRVELTEKGSSQTGGTAVKKELQKIFPGLFPLEKI
jgi:hypothetical protein